MLTKAYGYHVASVECASIVRPFTQPRKEARLTLDPAPSSRRLGNWRDEADAIIFYINNNNMQALPGRWFYPLIDLIIFIIVIIITLTGM